MQHHPEEFVLPFEKTNKQTKKTCHQFPLQMHFLSKPTLVSKQNTEDSTKGAGKKGRQGWVDAVLYVVSNVGTNKAKSL